MTYTNIYDKFFTQKLTKDVIEIIRPLKKIGIIYFFYVEIIDSRYFRALVSNASIAQAFTRDYEFLKEVILSFREIIKPGFYSVSSIINFTKSKKTKDYYEERLKITGISDVIVAIKDQINIRKIYAFGVVSLSYINRDHLEIFISYFDDVSCALINKNDKIQIPNEWIEYFFSLDPSCENFPNFIYNSKQSEEEFLNTINAKKYKSKKLQEQYFLSYRENQCLELILQNKLTKQIAYSLGLSARTIESYIDSLKIKLNCRTKNEIISRFL